MTSALEELRTHTMIAADTADYEAIKAFDVTDATTNPSIILKAASDPQYHQLLKMAVQYGSRNGKTLKEKIDNSMDMVNVLFAKNILNVIRGRVHVQIDTKLAFDSQASVTRALKLSKLLERENVPRDRVLIKLPSTWEGIQAASILERDHNVSCNMTTMFSLVQAAACAEASVSCVSPFVGRVGMWYTENKVEMSMDNHRGVLLLAKISNYMKKFSSKTKVVAAYFLNTAEVRACSIGDYVTIPIRLLKELATEKVTTRKVTAPVIPVEAMKLNEAKFRWLMNEDMMATSLLSETISKFAADFEELEDIIKDMLLNQK